MNGPGNVSFNITTPQGNVIGFICDDPKQALTSATATYGPGCTVDPTPRDMFGRASAPAIYQAMVIRSALRLYAKTGMQVNRAYTPSAMMRTARRITGVKGLKSRDYAGAAAALDEWITTEGRGDSIQKG